uniref:Saposin B-type domain-containing protein n=1 Tax=Rhabditophanes sp. KR3021 TaxID=114890 RepID=A0AC35TZF0_9BILA
MLKIRLIKDSAFTNIFVLSLILGLTQRTLNYQFDDYDTDSTDEAREEISLMLGCTMCKSILKNVATETTVFISEVDVQKVVSKKYCGKIGLFTKVCQKTIDSYWDDIWAIQSNGTNIDDNNFQNCQSLGLCPASETIQICIGQSSSNNDPGNSNLRRQSRFFEEL